MCFAFHITILIIFAGKCPSYNSYQGNMDEIDCSTDHGGTCPKDLYKSPSSVLCKHQHEMLYISEYHIFFAQFWSL